jgi:hypothetical protein
MTSLNNETKPADDTKQEESQAIIVAPEPPPQMPKLKADAKLWNEVSVLADMLSYCRPHNSKTERGFIGKYLTPVGVKFDKKGNAHKIIGDAPVIWSSHTDTVHDKKGMHKVVYWVDKDGDTYLGTDTGSCLGADDTAGIWIMLNMIKAKIPGHYIFHRGEECGGVGSRWIAQETKELLKSMRFAIAFDRRDLKSIITHQGSKKCCSDEFAKALAEQIGMGHECDATGAWTDTAAYTDNIAECTNISVGYFNAHSKMEKLNIDYLFKLRDAMCKIDVTKFVAVRKPGDNSYRYSGRTVWHSYGYDGWTDDFGVGGGYAWPKESNRPEGGFTSAELDRKYGYNSWYQWFNYHGVSGYWVPIKGVVAPNPDKWRKKRDRKRDQGVVKGWVQKQAEMFAGAAELREMRMLIADNNGIIADLLDSQGYGPLELREYIRGCGGTIYDDIPGY